MSAKRDAVFRQHIELVNSLVPDLTAPAAVAFAIGAFERQRFALRSATRSIREQEWLDRLAQVQEEWWRWCAGAEVTPRAISVEAQELLDALDRRKLPDPFRRGVLSTCQGLFSALEEKDYGYAKYSVFENFSLVEMLEEHLEEDVVDALVLDEVKRQEQELLVLADGFGPTTRATLMAEVADGRLLGEYAWHLPLQSLPD